jgi:tetratricopeptide (TPR) repeat protein
MSRPLLHEISCYLSIIIGLWLLIFLKPAYEDIEQIQDANNMTIGNGSRTVQTVGYICILFGLIQYYKAGNIRKKLKEKKETKEANERLWELEDAKWAQEIKNKNQERIDKEILTKRGRLKFARSLVEKKQFEKAIEIFGNYEEGINIIPELKKRQAEYHEKLLEFDEAANIYKELGMDDDTIRVRKLKAEQGAVKVTQKVVHGDEVTKTEIKDSVINRSNIGASSDDKLTKIKELKELHDAGAIDDDEFKQMKKEILGK